MPWLSQWEYPLPEEDLISWTFDHCDYDRDKPVYVDLDNTRRTLSWNRSRLLVRKIVAGFRAAGLQPGDCVSITSFNDIMYCMAFLGTVGSGGVFSGSNPVCTPYEIAHHVKTAKVKFVLVEPELLEAVLEGAKGVAERKKSFVFNVRGQECPRGFRSWEWLLQQGEEDWVRFTGEEECRNTAVARLTTSGMTGPPKMAVQSHYNATTWYTMTAEIRAPEWDHEGYFKTGDVVYCNQVKALITEKLASYKQLTGGVLFVDEIPKSASGKILKRVLRDEAAKESSAGAGRTRAKL